MAPFSRCLGTFRSEITLKRLSLIHIFIYATDQIIDLIANGMNHIHIYSMNKPEVAEAIISNLSAIIKA